MDDKRGTGRTTRQMQDAPEGSVFVWCNSRIDYAKRMARELGRTDLRIFGPDIFRCDRRDRLRGLRIPAVIVDHAYRPATDQEADSYYEALAFFKQLIR